MIKSFVTTAAVLAGLAAGAPAMSQTGDDGNWTWSGPYVGVNLGYGGGTFKDLATGTRDAEGTQALEGRFRQSSSGVIGGGQAGYNLELPNGVVLGLETDLAASDIGANSAVSAVDGVGDTVVGNVQSKIDSLGTARGRIGRAMFNGRFLPYVTGGFAYGGVKSSVNYACSACGTSFAYDAPTTTRTGWTAGAGAEYALTRHLSMKAEYLYTDLGREDVASGATYALPGETIYNANVSNKVDANVVRVGLNYRF